MKLPAYLAQMEAPGTMLVLLMLSNTGTVSLSDQNDQSQAL